MATADILGKGWKFPVKVNKRGGLSYSEGAERIQDAIWIVLGTAKRERLMRPNFGAGVHDYVFDPNSSVNRAQMAAEITEALTRWEPRIELAGVRIEEGHEPNQVLAYIDYRLNNTNELFNLVYPLYIEEGVS